MNQGNSAMEKVSKGKGNPWFLLSLVIPVYFFTVFYRMAPSVMAGDLALDLNVELSELSVMSSMTFVAYGLMQLPSGIIVDAIGARKTICAITLLAAISNFCFAYSSSLTEASAARFLLGIGCAVTVPCSALLAKNFSSIAYGKANCLFLTIGFLGTVCAGIPLLFICQQTGWRMLMVGCGILSLALVCVCWFCMKESAKNSTKCFGEMLSDLFKGVRHVLGCRKFWPVALWFTFGISVYFSMGGLWWAPILIHGCGLSPDAASSVISVSYIIALPGMYILITWSDKVRSRKQVMIGSMVFSFISLLTLSLFGTKMGVLFLSLQGGCFSLFCGALGSISFISAKELFPVHISGTAIGAVQTLPYLVGTPLLQKLFGLVLDWRIKETGDVVLAYAQAGYVHIFFIAFALIMALVATETYAVKEN